LREANHHRWVQHFLTMRRDPDGAKERVHLDPDGRVKRIQRYYDDKMWRQTSGIACSLVPVATAQVAEDVSLPSLADLRHVLASRGVPSRDACLFDSTYELNEESGFLSLSEHHIAVVARASMPRQYRAMARDVCVGERCRIHASAKLFGPAVIQS